MDWVKIIAGIVSLAGMLATWLNDRREFTQGEDNAVAAAALELLKQTTAGKQLMERVTALPDPDLDKLLSDLATS